MTNVQLAILLSGIFLIGFLICWACYVHGYERGVYDGFERGHEAARQSMMQLRSLREEEIPPPRTAYQIPEEAREDE